MTVAYLPRDRFQPFSNGYEWQLWRHNNCEHGRGGCRNYNPNAASSRHGCPIECALALASCTDGQIRASIGLRGGLLEPGAGGTLVTAEGDASTWRCPEYKGRDEPDDRPRRGPRPSSGQMDLLDPRNVPDDVPVDGDPEKVSAADEATYERLARECFGEPALEDAA